MRTLKTYELYEAENFFNGKNLTKLPELSNTIIRLYCWDNKLTGLPKLPNKLDRLFCWNNELSKLPKLPSTLKTLRCRNNNLNELPELPKSLESLSCGKNNLPYNDINSYWLWFYNKYPEKKVAIEFNI